MSEDHDLIVSRFEEPAEVLRSRFQEWGYLYLPGYMPADRCAGLLDEFVDLLAPHVVKNGEQATPVLAGEPFYETDAIWDAVYPKMQSLEAFHGFFHQPETIELMELVTGTRAFVYPMKMARISTPGKVGYETPPHQDAHSHNAGPTMAGIWVALHDVDANMGRLKLLPKSHLGGKRPVFQAQGVGGVQCEIYPDETLWHVSDVQQGDVIIFHSCMVHKAEPNLSKDKVRMSIDTRFCDYGAPVFSLNLEPHHGWRIEELNWAFMYRNWQDTSLQYYWKDYPNFF
ncbi:MAG: phytanoyl-CoA dioxygenase family protein [Pseudomonadales bacterium]|nr:phytanoyl-CoA dioxygenase family protein [Pseudomonadales bacterium]